MNDYKIDNDTKFDMDSVEPKNLLEKFEEGDMEIQKQREEHQFISEEEKCLERLNNLIK